MKLTPKQIQTLQSLSLKAIQCARKDYPDIKGGEIVGVLTQISGDILLETYEVPRGEPGRTKYYDIHVEQSK